MKPTKMLIVAALMAMTAISAPSAMAESTGLCAEDANPCESVVAHVHETSVKKAKLLTTLGTVECEVLFLGDVTEGAPAVIKGAFTYTSCNLGCTLSEENGPAEVKVLKEGHETASVTGGGLISLQCALINVHCTYKLTGLNGTDKGPLLSTQTKGEVTFSEQTLTSEGGSSCPSTTKLDITTTPLITTYIVGAMDCVPDLINGSWEEPGIEEPRVCKGFVGQGKGAWRLTS